MVDPIEIAKIPALKERLSGLPDRQPKRLSRKAAICEMRAEIQSALDRGYTLEEIVQILASSDGGFANLSLSTLRTYLRGDRKKASERTARKNLRAIKSSGRVSVPHRPETPATRQTGNAPSAASPRSRTTAALTEDV